MSDFLLQVIAVGVVGTVTARIALDYAGYGTESADLWERVLDRVAPADTAPSINPDTTRRLILRATAYAALVGCGAWLIGMPSIPLGFSAFFISFVPAACRELRGAWQYRRSQMESADDDNSVDDEADHSADGGAEIDKDDLGEGAIPETSVIPSWITCPVTRSLGSAKIHALLSLLRSGINRSAFCAATGKPQSDYPIFLQNWFDMGLLERSGGKTSLTYAGRIKVGQIIDQIEAM